MAGTHGTPPRNGDPREQILPSMESSRPFSSQEERAGTEQRQTQRESVSRTANLFAGLHLDTGPSHGNTDASTTSRYTDMYDAMPTPETTSSAISQNQPDRDGTPQDQNTDNASLVGEMESSTAIYNVQDEELPPERIYNNQLQDALKGVKAQLTRLTDTMRGSEPVQNNEHSSGLFALYQEAEGLSHFEFPETRVVGFIGDTGVGLFVCRCEFI